MFIFIEQIFIFTNNCDDKNIYIIFGKVNKTCGK